MNLVSSTPLLRGPYMRIEISSDNLRTNTKFVRQGYVINPWGNHCLLCFFPPMFMFSKKCDYHNTSNTGRLKVSSTWLCHIVKVGYFVIWFHLSRKLSSNLWLRTNIVSVLSVVHPKQLHSLRLSSVDKLYKH